MQKQGRIYILNLAGDLSESLEEFFQHLDVEILERNQCEDYQQLNFILIASEFDAANASKDYSVDKNEIQLICLGEVKQMQSFLLNNGKLAIGEELLDSGFGKLILHKFFNKSYDIHLDESYPTTFKELNEFKLMSHLNSGFYSDQVILDAFNNGYNIVSIRSFLDHAIYYLTYLKQAGLAGAPFQVEYSNSSEVYAVNIHLSVKNFVAEYLLDSFGSVNSKDPLQYLLGVVQRSCDFMEITYVEKPGKLILTGFWTQSGKKKVGGVAFNNILTSAQSLRQLDRRIKEYQGAQTEQLKQQNSLEQLKDKNLPGGILEIVLKSEEEEGIFKEDPKKAAMLVAFVAEKFDEIHPNKNIDDMSSEDFQEIVADYPDLNIKEELTEEDIENIQEKVKSKNITNAYQEEVEKVRGVLAEDDDFKKELTETLSEEVVNKVTGKIDIDETLNRIMGSKDDDKSSQLVKGNKDKNDANQLVKGTKDEADSNQHINGSKTDEEAKHTLKGGKEAADNFMAKLSGLKDDKNNFMSNLSKSLADETKKMNWNVSSGGPGNNQPARELVSRVLQNSASNLDPTVKSFLQDQVPKSLNNRLHEFSNSLGKKVNELSDKDMAKFQEQIPEIVNKLTSGPEVQKFKMNLLHQDEVIVKDLEQRPNQFINKIKDKMQNKLNSKGIKLEPSDKDGGAKLNPASSQQQIVKEILQESMKEVIAQDFVLKNASREEVTQKEKLLLKSLTEDLNLAPEDAAEVVQEAITKVKHKEMQTVVDNLFEKQKAQESTSENSEPKGITDNALMEKLYISDLEKKNLEKRMHMLENQLESTETAFRNMEQIAKKAQIKAQESAKKLSEEISAHNLMSAEEKKAKLEALRNGTLTQDDANNFANVIEKESEILDVAKDADTLVKKLQIEMGHREAKFKSEIQRYVKLVKAKDLVVQKAKEGIKNFSEKKETEKKELMRQVTDLNQRLEDNNVGQLKAQINELKSLNENLKNSQAAYKKKVEVFAQKVNSSQNKDITKRMQEENRSLKSKYNQLENNLAKEKKQFSVLEQKLKTTKMTEGKLQADYSAAKGKIISLESKFKKLQEEYTRLKSKPTAPNKATDVNLSQELKKSNQQVISLQQKLKEMQLKLNENDTKNQTSTSNSTNTTMANPGAREKKLEQDLKKVQAELSKARAGDAERKKEIVKMKAESTGLKNQIKALKRDLEKAKSAGKSNKKAA